MNAATLAGLAPGRFVLGIGTSSRVIVEQWNGIELARPYQRARDTLRFLRAALAGEKVSAGYESFAISGFRLDPPPAPVHRGRSVDRPPRERGGDPGLRMKAFKHVALDSQHSPRRRAFALMRGNERASVHSEPIRL